LDKFNDAEEIILPFKHEEKDLKIGSDKFSYRIGPFLECYDTDNKEDSDKKINLSNCQNSRQSFYN
jgi:hypothetical protein